jgi:hypothetical protein
MKSFAAITIAFFAANLLHADDMSAPAAPAAPTPAPASVAPATSSSSTAVQVDVTKLLNARVVATFTDGKVVPLGINLDGAGGVATKAAASALKGNPDTAVPDDGTFPANADHPDVVLHFSNADGTGFQVRRMSAPEDFSFDVPPKNYSKMYFFFTSGASGPAPMKVTLTYQDGSTEDRDIICPDWWPDLKPTDVGVFYLAHNLTKWGKGNNIMEKDHHNILGISVDVTPAKVLTSIKVHKTRPLVCFWGATGVPAN